jgi:hypothetical protein
MENKAAIAKTRSTCPVPEVAFKKFDPPFSKDNSLNYGSGLSGQITRKRRPGRWGDFACENRVGVLESHSSSSVRIINRFCAKRQSIQELLKTILIASAHDLSVRNIHGFIELSESSVTRISS